MTTQVRKTVIEGLLLLIKIVPRIDPIVKDLLGHIESDKVDKEAQVEAAEALALILKSNGNKVQPAMA